MNIERDVKRSLIREQRQCLAEAEAACEATILATPNVSDSKGQDDLLASLRNAFGADAPLVELVAFADCNFREAAARLGLSHEATRKRHARAMKKLRRRLSQSDPKIGF